MFIVTEYAALRVINFLSRANVKILTVYTLNSHLLTLNAQVTHSRIGRRISHGYDPASFVAIRIGP